MTHKPSAAAYLEHPQDRPPLTQRTAAALERTVRSKEVDHPLTELYGARWRVETNLRHLKETMGIKVLHCQGVAGVRKELAVFALVCNLVRAVTPRTAAGNEKRRPRGPAFHA